MDRQTHEDDMLKKNPQSEPATRDAEAPSDLPGGTEGYAGRGDTDSGPEAPGGTEGYANRDARDADKR